MFFLILHILNTYLVCRCGFFLLFLLIYKDTTFKTSLFFRQMNWIQLISDKRLGLEDYHNPHSGATSTGLCFPRRSAACRTKHRCFHCRAVFLCTTASHIPWKCRLWAGLWLTRFQCRCEINTPMPTHSLNWNQ